MKPKILHPQDIKVYHIQSKARPLKNVNLGTMIPILNSVSKRTPNQKAALCHMILQTIKISLRYVGTIFHKHRCIV
ncbi:hypothetical protein HanIR_Chr01g0041881 [Helianthus annuus]|nr:hypothetical protein HanIR_Chr01g0041881 [Helianthus annuus]